MGGFSGFGGGGNTGGAGGGGFGGGGMQMSVNRGGGFGGLVAAVATGIIKSLSAGLNYYDEWGSKIKVTGSYFFSNSILNRNKTHSARPFMLTILWLT